MLGNYAKNFKFGQISNIELHLKECKNEMRHLAQIEAPYGALLFLNSKFHSFRAI
jgi:hypothetical protein